MSGFAVPRTTYKLEFDEPEYAGLVVRVRGATMDELFELDEAAEALTAAKKADEVHQAIIARNELFARKIIDWNLEEDGVPVPVTAEVMGSFEAPFIGRMIGAWRRAVAGVPAPLEKPSSGGEMSPVESTLMAIPSESLAS